MAKNKPANGSKMFTRDQERAIRKAQRSLSDVLPIIDKCKNCNIDTDEIVAEIDRLQEFFQSVDREFISGK